MSSRLVEQAVEGAARYMEAAGELVEVIDPVRRKVLAVR